MQIAEYRAVDSPPVSIPPNSTTASSDTALRVDSVASAHLYGFRQTVQTALPLVVGDVCAAVAATTVAYYATRAVWPSAELSWSLLTAGVTTSLVAVNYLMGLYPGAGLSSIAEMRITTKASLYTMMVFLLFALPLFSAQVPARVLIPATWVLLTVLVPLFRLPVRAVCSRFRWWGQPALIMGSDENASATYSFFHRNPRLGLRPLGIVGDSEDSDGWMETGEAVRTASNACLIVAVPRRTPDGVQTELHCYWQGPRRMLLSHLNGATTIGSQAHGFLDNLGVPQRGETARAGVRFFKRVFDIVAVTVGGLFILPLIAVVALLIKIQSPGPVFFRQERVGLNGRRFRVWKFRTMVCDADKALADHLAANPAAREEYERNRKLRNDPRVTSIGRWLRKTSMDELPQLWNVLRGEMTLVGPRPIMTDEIDRWGDRFDSYCAVTPGITGLWQVSGRNETTFAERVDLDAFYVSNYSLWLDLYILVLTIKVVMFRQGAY